MLQGYGVDSLAVVTAPPRNARASWAATPGVDSYELSYRCVGFDTWTIMPSTGCQLLIPTLAPSATFEFRIRARKGQQWGDYSELVNFTMPTPKPVPPCGETTDTVHITNTVRLTEIFPGTTVTAGPFEVTLLKVKRNANGSFAGEGYGILPFMNAEMRLKVKFTNAVFNTSFQLIAGSIPVCTNYTPGSNAILGLDGIITGGGGTGIITNGSGVTTVTLPDITIPGTGSITYNPADSTITVTTPDTTITVSVVDAVAADQPITVSDGAGNTFTVDPTTGAVTQTTNGTGIPGLPTGPLAPGTFSDERLSVAFTAAAGNPYAFDPGDSRYSSSNIMWAEYSQLTCGGRAYPIPFQLIPVGQTATIKAEVTLRANGLDLGKLVFRTGAGATLVATRDGSIFQFTLLAAKADEGYDLQALYPKTGGGYELVGQLRVVSYTPRTVRVKLIPVGQTVANASGIGAELNALLKSFGVAVTLEVGAPLEDKSWDLDGNGQLAVNDKGFFSLLTDEQKALCTVLRTAPGYDPTTFYLFVLPAQGALQGDMPRAKQMGYLFGEPSARTVAHELMHGVFKLEHTFSSTYGLAQGSTTNLMDYPPAGGQGGATLVKHQWDCLFSSGVVIGMFEKEEDGA
ncbi:fibronectin type III domain-containing protein, partial [Williamwhitmania taraxaci]|uniref:fibronectin type III domain-containing protein n=1 Tax=Williamwhitmania taraxaci TaxID=1640674 RepID=UPI001BAFDA9E